VYGAQTPEKVSGKEFQRGTEGGKKTGREEADSPVWKNKRKNEQAGRKKGGGREGRGKDLESSLRRCRRNVRGTLEPGEGVRSPVPEMDKVRKIRGVGEAGGGKVREEVRGSTLSFILSTVLGGVE